MPTDLSILIGVGVAALVATVALTSVLRALEERRTLKSSLGYVLFAVTMPRRESAPYEKGKEEIGAFEQILLTLRNFARPVVMEIAVPHIGEEIQYYFAASRQDLEALERMLQSFAPDADIRKVSDYNIFNPHGAAIASTAYLKEHYALPLKTYRRMDADPAAAITNALSKLAAEGEGAAVQFVFHRAAANAPKMITGIREALARGEPKSAAIQAGIGGALRFIGETLAARRPQQPETRQAGIDDELVKLVTEKSGKPLFGVNLRLVASAATGARADSIAAILEDAFSQFSEARGNSLGFRRAGAEKARPTIFDFSFRTFRPGSAMTLNAEELAGLMHLPTSGLGTPKVEAVRAKSALAPLDLPAEGLVLGKNVFRGEERVVRILPDDRRRHMYIVGQTGTGKSALLEEMARQDMEAGEGLALIDPHGDLAESVLGFVPPHRIGDVVYFNPTDIERPIGLNILEFDSAHPEQKTFVINEMIEIMDKLYDLRQVGGPMFEQYLRNAMLLIMGDPVLKPTITEIPKVLADAAFRKELLSRCTNPSVVSFWTKEAERAGGEFALANMVPYITSKLNPFIANDIIRPIVGQTETRFNLRDIMDNKKILVVNLAKGVLGETNSYLLGMIIVGKIMMAALSRVDRPESERTDFTLYVDEFQNVTTRTVASILAEARKYRLSMVMAHQFIAQLKDEIRDAVFGNVGSVIAFRVGPLDADLLEKQFLPAFTKQDLVNIDNYNAYVKLLIRGQVSSPFNIETFPPRPSDRERRDAVKTYSRELYGKPRADVEAEIAGRV